MKVTDLSIPGLKLIQPIIFRDHRGLFYESYREERYRDYGIDSRFVQDNHSFSTRGTIRGLHYQSAPGQVKLIRVCKGRIFDVAVDIRQDSPSFGQWEGIYLDAEEHHQLYIPVGFAHGFCVVSDEAIVLYKVSSPYNSETECGLMWNDPELGIQWPTDQPELSARDTKAESFTSFRNRINR